ncbi:MAG: DNA-processing protein DprA, partial [Clostridia bacterium]|nr:DNA-processing protein DprA [Clostridia bacterium]
GEPTVAVLGCGHGSKYLKENRPLRDVITTCGATVTEYPPLTDSNKGYFPVRNRIISGMSVGTVVIEAKDKSGSLITARHATEQSRDIFAMPALELGSSSIGCDRLIEDGAKAVYCPFDVIELYLGKYPEKITINESVNLFEDLTCPGNGTVLEDSAEINRRHEQLEEERRNKDRPEKREITDPLTDEAIRVYATFARDPLSIKQLAESVIMPTSSLLGALTELELYGYIELLPDTKYSIK